MEKTINYRNALAALSDELIVLANTSNMDKMYAGIAMYNMVNLVASMFDKDESDVRTDLHNDTKYCVSEESFADIIGEGN